MSKGTGIAQIVCGSILLLVYLGLYFSSMIAGLLVMSLLAAPAMYGGYLLLGGTALLFSGIEVTRNSPERFSYRVAGSTSSYYGQQSFSVRMPRLCAVCCAPSPTCRLRP